MANITVETTGLDELIAMFDNAPQVIDGAISRTMQATLDAFKQAVQVETPVNFGTLRASITTEIDGTPVDLTGTVSTPLIYGWPVEDGRKPGRMPPVEAIELWVIRKLGIAPPESRSVAFIIARSIGRKGTSGAKMFQKGFDNALPSVNKMWDKLLDTIVSEI